MGYNKSLIIQIVLTMSLVSVLTVSQFKDSDSLPQQVSTVVCSWASETFLAT